MSAQLPLRFRPHGGKRKNAGRKRVQPGRPNVPHRVRARHSAAHPVHVTLRARAGLPSLRDAGIFRELREAVRQARSSPAVGDAFRVVEFSIQNDHAHFIIERPTGTSSHEACAGSRFGWRVRSIARSGFAGPCGAIAMTPAN